jgi:hypothetical protein
MLQTIGCHCVDAMGVSGMAKEVGMPLKRVLQKTRSRTEGRGAKNGAHGQDALLRITLNSVTDGL